MNFLASIFKSPISRAILMTSILLSIVGTLGGTLGGTVGGTIGGTFAVPVLKAVGTTWSPNIAHAQTEVTANLDAVAELSGLSTPDDPRDVIANLIYGFLGILGVIFTVLVIWAGLRWMLAAGDPKKVNSAKQMLISAIIGFGRRIVIISHYAPTLVSEFPPETSPSSLLGAPSDTCTSPTGTAIGAYMNS